MSEETTIVGCNHPDDQIYQEWVCGYCDDEQHENGIKRHRELKQRISDLEATLERVRGLQRWKIVHKEQRCKRDLEGKWMKVADVLKATELRAAIGDET